MGIFDGVFGKKREHTTYRTVLVLTPLGKTKAEKFDLPGTKWQVLTCLNENGPSTIDEIASETKMSEGKVKAIVKGLIATGYVRKASASE